MAMPDKIVAAGIEAACDLQNFCEDVLPDNILDNLPSEKWGAITNAVTAVRAPTTLDEALRDYAMFGKWCEYMASSFDDYSQHTIGEFVVGWTLWRLGECETGEVRNWPEYVAFVKEEMGR